MKLKLVEGSGGLYERNNDAEAAASIMFLSQGGKVKLIFWDREGFNGLSANLSFVSLFEYTGGGR